MYTVGDEPDARFSFANERTFLAWIRTGLAFLTAGVAIFALVAIEPAMEVEARAASLVLVVTGVLCGASAFFRWARNERALRESRPLPSSPVMPTLVLVLVVVALIALILLLP